MPSEEDLNNISMEMRNAESTAFGISMGTENFGPFSSKRVCRQSDAVHAEDEYETVLLPGDTEEINTFKENTMKLSKIQIRINIPAITLTIGSKQLYETIYNRLNTDLLMWEPISPLLKRTAPNIPAQMFQSLFNADMMTSIYASSPLPESRTMNKMPHSMLSNTSDSETSMTYDDSDNESLYFSTNEKSKQQQQLEYNKYKVNEGVKYEVTPSACSVEIILGKGEVSLFMPVRDTEKRVLPGQAGRIHFTVNKLQVFCVSGYNSDNLLNYVCLQSDNIEIYHCGLIPVDVPLDLTAELGGYMQSTLYYMPNGLTKGDHSVKEKNRENISFVIEIKKLPEPRIKRIRLSTGIHKLALKHNPTPGTHNWLKQLIDFLDVLDYPIEGYIPYSLITEMQLHVWDSAIDYRPTNLNYRAVVEIGNLSVSSNVIPAVDGCNLRFVIDDWVLSIAPYDKYKYNLADCQITCIPASNLVPVLDVGLLDISLRLCDGATEKSPKFDLRCSVHEAHLRTCSDTGCALAQLIAHLANDGDVAMERGDEDDAMSLQSSAYSDAQLFASQTVVPEITKQQQDHVSLMMAEAVQETVTSSHTSDTFSSSTHMQQTAGIEVFYFPDESKKVSEHELACPADEVVEKTELCDILNFESNVMLTSYYNIDLMNDDALPQIKADFGDIVEHRNQQTTNKRLDVSSQEDEFCIIADEEKGFMDNCGIKSMHISDDPLRIVDNHFNVPSAKLDLLLPPENFPTAQFRYTLCEMNFTWHLYGGNDFDDKCSNIQKPYEEDAHTKFVNMSEAYKYGVSYSKSTKRICFDKKPKEKITWKSTGGAQRNHEVLVEIQLSKVRFSHEEYPLHTSQASRQVLLIGEFEIRDRLQSSEINKFLYHPKNKNIVHKSEQNVMVVKALHVRPNPAQSTSQECSLRISLLPMRLHIDQDTLLFIAEFFASIDSNSCIKNDSTINTHKLSHSPVMSVDEVPEAVQDLQARHMVATNLDLLMDNQSTCSAETKSLTPPPTTASRDNAAPIYFREIIFSPDVRICLDYHGRRFEMSRGPIAGLLMGLGQLHCSEITLKKVVYRRGILGLEKLLTFLCKEWLKDIKRNQLPKILSGVGPTHAFVQLCKLLLKFLFL